MPEEGKDSASTSSARTEYGGKPAGKIKESGIAHARHACYRRDMIPPPETIRVSTARVACDGASDIPGGAALGHPRVFLEIDETGFVDCGYCDRRFVLIGGPADEGAKAA